MTVSEKIRAHALSPKGGQMFFEIEDIQVHYSVDSFLRRSAYVLEVSCDLTEIERRMFALFVSYALEGSS